MSGKKRVKAGTSKAAAADRRARFIEEYLTNGGNATQAAIAVGFPKKSAHVRGAELVKDRKVKELLDARRAESLAVAQEKTHLTAEEVMASLARDLRFDPVRVFNGGGLIPFEKMDEDTRRAIRGLSYDAHGRPNIKFPEQTAAREQGMKHFGLYEADNKQKPAPVLPPILNIVMVPGRR